MSDGNSINSAFSQSTTWALIKEILESSSDSRHNWSIEEFKEQELMRATLEPREKLRREIVLNIFIMELSRNILQEHTTNYEVYKKYYWVEVRIDEDVYPYYKRKEKPVPIIAETRQKIIDALTPKKQS